eukprot:6568016-Pyramimonas_sp.AAC.1
MPPKSPLPARSSNLVPGRSAMQRKAWDSGESPEALPQSSRTCCRHSSTCVIFGRQGKRSLFGRSSATNGE